MRGRSPDWVLETARLSLRRLTLHDLDALATLYRDPEVRRHLPDGTLSREETAEEIAWFRHGHPDHPELGLWATIDKESGRFIGRCGLLPWHIDGRDEVEIAYLLNRAYWGRSLAGEAARALVAHGFEKLGRRRLIALIDAANQRSVRVALAAGLHFERKAMVDGKPCQIYAIVR